MRILVVISLSLVILIHHSDNISDIALAEDKDIVLVSAHNYSSYMHECTPTLEGHSP